MKLYQWLCVCDFVSTANVFGEQNGLESPPTMSAPLLSSQQSMYSYRPDIITAVVWTGVFLRVEVETKTGDQRQIRN